ncbi:GNAT family N-acetyltransferase [Hwangdonia sp.]|uniref:GNAT family N-acetyltransferase n=1 Tax=Hwangdonia sp. TaxID=1883432 RepID=UPI003AB46125
MNKTFTNFKITSFDSNKYDDFFSLIDANRNRLEDFFAGTLSKTKTLEDTANYCKTIEQKVKNKSYFPFTIYDLNSNLLIGLVDVKNIDWSIPKAEIGYFIDINYEGQGVISKSLGLVIDYLLETYKFKKLLCRANSTNLGSINVALKNGFEFEGTIRRDYKTTKGDIVDLNYYGRIF